MKRLLPLLLVFATGCSTLARGPMQRVHISSEPEGAEVELIRCGVSAENRTTPVTILIPRRVQRCTVLLVHEDYEPARILLERRTTDDRIGYLDAVEVLCGDCDSLTDIFLSLTVGGLLWGVGRGVDSAAGADYVLEPREVQVALVPRYQPLHEDP